MAKTRRLPSGSERLDHTGRSRLSSQEVGNWTASSAWSEGALYGWNTEAPEYASTRVLAGRNILRIQLAAEIATFCSICLVQNCTSSAVFLKVVYGERRRSLLIYGKEHSHSPLTRGLFSESQMSRRKPSDEAEGKRTK